MPANDDEPGLTAELAEETAAAAERWPDEWPALRPLLNLPRLDRAAVFDAYADVMEQLPELHDEPGPEPAPVDPTRPKGNAGRAVWAAHATDRGIPVTKDMGRDAIIAAVDAAAPVNYGVLVHNSRRAALVMRMVAKLEDVIVLVAADPEVTRKWVAEADDMNVLTMFLRYARRTQLGEASSSGS